MTSMQKMNPKKTARIAGLLYLIIALLGIFSLLYGPENLIVPGDAAATANNIKASESLFRLAFVGDLLGQVIFIFLVLLLYRLLKPVKKNLAVLMVVLVLVGIPIAMLNDLNQIAALMILSGAEFSTGPVRPNLNPETHPGFARPPRERQYPHSPIRRPYEDFHGP